MSDGAGRPRRAVILAAGRGSRLGALTDDLAKTCQLLGDDDLLGRQCAQLAARGVDDVTVVVGHAAESVARRHPRVRTVLNARWSGTGSGASLLCARPWFACGEAVLLSHGDLAFADDVLDRLLIAAGSGSSTVLLDAAWRAETGDEVVGWSAADGRLAGVRKGPADGSAARVGEFVGLSVWQPELADAFARFGAGRAAMEDYEQPRLHEFVAGGAELRAVFLTGQAWWNVNHPADLRAARAAFGGRETGAS